jgi:hypothetical protein
VAWYGPIHWDLFQDVEDTERFVAAYDGLGRVVSTWVGTDDTPGSGCWSPTNNTPPSNMVDTADYIYDNNTLGGATKSATAI